MQALFLELVRLSLTGSVFALAVMALRLLLRKAPKWLLCLLWGVVALRLICPISMESRFSLMPDSLSSGQVLQDVGSGYVGEVDVLYESNAGYNAAVDAGRQPVYSGGSYYVVTEKNSLEAPKTVENTVYPILSWVWLAGMLGMLAYTGVSYYALKRKMKEATRLRENIWQCEQAESPFVLGIIKPRIYLPYQLGDSDTANVIAHEQAHIRRKDHWWKPIGFALLSVHWFNPVMWVAYILLCRDIEAACDEKVIRHMEKEQVRAYSTALLHCSIHRRRIAACPLAFGETGVKERIKRIMHYKKPGFWIVLAAVLVCAAVAVCFLTDPNVKTPKPILDPLSAEDVQWAQITIWEAETAHISLADQEISELMEILKSLEEKDFLSDQGKERNLSAMVNCGSTGILLHWDGVYTTFHFDSATELTLTHYSVKSEKLNAFFARFSSTQEETAPAVVKWFDYAQDHSGMSYEDTLEIRLEELPGVTFQYTPYEITAVQEGISTGLIAGLPIWNAYFTDLTGDGLPEICAQLSYGSGLIDTRVVVYDYANRNSYTLENRGYYDYYLHDADGCLYVEKRTHGTQELVSQGKLLYQDGYLRWAPEVEIPHISYAHTLQEVAALVQQQDTDSFIGMSQDAVHGYWGEPDAVVHSFFGDIYHVPNSYESLVFGYDENGIVESVHIEYRNSPEEWGISLDVTFQSADAFDIVIRHSSAAQTVAGSIITSPEYEILALHNGEIISLGSYMRNVLGYDYAEPLMAWDSMLYCVLPDGELVIPGSLAPYGTLPAGQYVLRKPIALTDSAGKTVTMDYYAQFAITE